MKANYTKNMWFCDICGGAFLLQDVGYMDDMIDVCLDCIEIKAFKAPLENIILTEKERNNFIKTATSVRS